MGFCLVNIKKNIKKNEFKIVEMTENIKKVTKEQIYQISEMFMIFIYLCNYRELSQKDLHSTVDWLCEW